MDVTLANTIVANLKSAHTAEAKIDALVLAQIALVDCQQKTSGRVKELVSERDEAKARRLGARWALGLLGSIASVIGPVAAIKICKAIGILF